MRINYRPQFCHFVRLSLLWFIILISHIPAGATPPAKVPQQTNIVTASQKTETSTVKTPDSPPHLLWLLGEVSLGIITALFLLIIYSWHLRKVVNRKTRELKRLNFELEAKVQKRTLDLENSREEYREMYNHAERERKRTQTALRAEQEAIKQNLNFIDMLTHEYRTPLSILTSGLDIIERKCTQSGCTRSGTQLSKMRIAINRLLDIFESSLNREQLNTTEPQLNITNLELSTLLNTAIELISSRYSDHNIIPNNLPTSAVYLNGDEKLLNTVFSNILDNACKYSPPEHPVIINVNAGSGQLEVRIIDQGQGINPEESEHIFEKYYRSDQVGSKPGAGLGLFIVKEILTLHKGTVTVTSNRDTGTEVTVILPKKEGITHE